MKITHLTDIGPPCGKCESSPALSASAPAPGIYGYFLDEGWRLGRAVWVARCASCNAETLFDGPESADAPVAEVWAYHMDATALGDVVDCTAPIDEMGQLTPDEMHRLFPENDR